jgi:hypothetical protein
MVGGQSGQKVQVTSSQPIKAGCDVACLSSQLHENCEKSKQAQA